MTSVVFLRRTLILYLWLINWQKTTYATARTGGAISDHHAIPLKVWGVINNAWLIRMRGRAPFFPDYAAVACAVPKQSMLLYRSTAHVESENIFHHALIAQMETSALLFPPFLLIFISDVPFIWHSHRRSSSPILLQDHQYPIRLPPLWYLLYFSNFHVVALNLRSSCYWF